jgi:hypothetical protein
LRDGELGFAWTGDAAAAPWQGLRNSLLNLRIDNQEKLIALRKPQVVPCITLDLTKKTAYYPLSASDLPPPAQLVLEVTQLAPFDAPHRFQNDQRSSSAAGKVVIELTQPSATIELDLIERSGVPNVSVKGEYRLGQAAFELTMSRVNNQAKAFQKSLATAQVKLPATRASLPGLQAQLAAAQRMPIPGGQAAAAARFARDQAISQAQSKLNNAVRDIARMEQQIPNLQRALEALLPVGNLGNALHEKARIHYRIYATLDYQGVPLPLDLVVSSDQVASPPVATGAPASAPSAE